MTRNPFMPTRPAPSHFGALAIAVITSAAIVLVTAALLTRL